MFFGILFNGGRFLKGGAIQLEFTSEQSRLVLGRGGEKNEGVHIPIDHDNIENQHAMISQDEAGQFFVTDLKGEDGTWVWMNRGWQRLTPFWPYPIQKGTRLAFGKVEGEQESLFLKKRLALSYEVREGESTKSLILDPRIIIRNKQGDSTENPDPKNILQNKPFSSFYGSLAQKFKNAFSRGSQDPFQLQDRANTFERKGQLGKAEAIHQKAVFIGRTLYRGATELSPYAFNKPARDWGVVRDNYGEFLKRQHRWEEAAAQFEQAGQLLLLANLNTTDDIIRLATKAKAYHIFRGLAEEAKNEENPSVAAVFYERAGHNVPWTFEVNTLGNDWDPLLTFIQMKAHAALNYRLAGEEYKRHYQTVWTNLSRVTGYVQPAGFQSELGKLFTALKELVDNGIIRSEDITSFVQPEVDILRLKYLEEE